jgi:hypothetical protein
MVPRLVVFDVVVIHPGEFAIVAPGAWIYEADAPPAEGEEIMIHAADSGLSATSRARVESVDPDPPHRITAQVIDAAVS